MLCLQYNGLHFVFVDKKSQVTEELQREAGGGEISGKQNSEVEPSRHLFLGTSRLVFRTLARGRLQ